MSYAHSPAVQDLSKAVFGQKNRLPVMLAIAESTGLFTASELVQQLGVASQSLIQLPLKALEEARLITRLDTPSDRCTYYQRNDSSAWALARELVEAALGTEVRR